MSPKPRMFTWMLIGFVVSALGLVPAAFLVNVNAFFLLFAVCFFFLVAVIYFATTGKRKTHT